ncbi:hypothetical protein GGR52DRAFT_215953 [Hypoxylon sp. FL1284]|nr:hypothetical protein GGR52DRAFT_215953 [Hypoxylon sp. FL1284]
MASSSLALALLIIYATLSLPVIYLAVKHGVRHGAIIGWFFLFAFCTLKIVANAIQLSDPNSPSGLLVSSIGLSPLLAAACGVLHEVRVYMIPKSRRPFDVTYLVLFHLVVTTAIALVASGASKMSDATATRDELKSSEALVKAGMVTLLLCWLSLAFFTMQPFLYLLTPVTRKTAGDAGAKYLLLAVTISIPFLGIRVLERLVYYFTQNEQLNPVTGSLGLQVGLEVIEELIVTLSLIITGIMSRNLKHFDVPT